MQLAFEMQYFHLEQPLDEIIISDEDACESLADYLEVEMMEPSTASAAFT